MDPNYLFLIGLDNEISTRELFTADPDRYLHYCQWYESRLDSRRFRNPRLSIETRLAAYLRIVAERGQRFCLGIDAIPSAKWLREHLDIHRNTMGKYIRDAQTTRQVHLSLTVGCQLAFAAGIYPQPTRLEENAVKNVLENRLDLINDYHLTRRSKVNMVRCLAPIVRSGKNELFTIPKSYPYLYDLDAKGQPVKRISEHTVRKTVARSRSATSTRPD